jgi:hypothetical protein
MRQRRVPFVLVAAGVLPVAIAACQSGTTSAGAPPVSTDSGSGDSGSSDSGGDVALESQADGGTPRPRPPIQIGPDGGSVLGLSVSPVALAPSFTASTTDYSVACGAGDNAITVDVSYASGTQSYALQVSENQAVLVAGQYWIRCLPHDFPPITVTQHPDAGAPTPGFYLVNSSAYAVVLDTNGVPVWYERGTNVFSVDSPAHDTLSFMPNGMGPFVTTPQPAFDVLDLDTLVRTSVVAPVGPTDLHELQTLPSGDHLLFSYSLVTGVDLTGLNGLGTKETIADCQIDEVDPAGNLVWSWLASDHVDPVRESIVPLTDKVSGQTVIDVFHCNSIDVDSQGNLLLSLREASAIFYISRSTSKVVWKLGGTGYSKDDAMLIEPVADSQATFSLQHDARFRPNGNVTLFDDHGASAGVARGVEYAIDTNDGAATLAWQFLGTAQSQFEGSFRRYADGESVIGWGYVPNDPRVVTEVGPDGNDVLDIAFGGNGNQTYRALKVPLSQLDIGVLRQTAGQ